MRAAEREELPCGPPAERCLQWFWILSPESSAVFEVVEWSLRSRLVHLRGSWSTVCASEEQNPKGLLPFYLVPDLQKINLRLVT